MARSIAECWEKYATEHVPLIVNQDRHLRFWNQLCWFGDRDAESLSSREVDEYIAMRGTAPGAINRELTALAACLRYAERTGFIGRAPYIKKQPKPPPKMRALNREECRKLLDATDKGIWQEQAFVRLALATGQRPGAICDLTWSQVNMEDEIIDFRPISEKAGRMKRRAVVPINDMAREALTIAEANINGPYVIHWHDGTCMKSGYKVVSEAARRAGITDLSPHILRHTVASLLLQEGHDLLMVSRLLGHSNTTITEEVYFKHPTSWLRKATKSLKF